MNKKSLLFAFSFGALSLTGNIYAQSLKDILNSNTVKNTITTLTGGKDVNTSSIEGSWTYVQPAVQLKGDNALTNIAGVVATTELEKKLDEYYRKAGISEGSFGFTFASDSTFTNTLKGRTYKGSYSIDPEENTITLNYSPALKLKLATLVAHPVVTNDELTLLFNADKLLDLIGKLSLLSKNNSIQTISKVAEQYDEALVGFRTKR